MTSRTSRAVALGALALVVSAELVARGPARAVSGASKDLTVHYAAARVWVSGGDPYDMPQVADAFVAGGGPEESAPSAASMPSVYPPVTHAIQAPLALVSWPTAVVVFQVTTIALVLLALLALARSERLSRAKGALLVLAGLALAPLHTGLASGQVAIPSAALLVIGWSGVRDRPALSGALIALGAALKPQLAVPVVLAAFARPDVRWLVSAGGVFLALLGVGGARLALAGHDPVRDWLRAVAAASATGGMNSPDPSNPASLTLISLDMLLARVAGAQVSTAVSYAFAAPLAVLAVWRIRSAPSRRARSYAVSLLIVVTLLAMYHRVYDAVLLWILLAALVRDWASLSARWRLAGTALFAAFLVPGPAILDLLARSGRAPAGLVHSRAWTILLIPHQVWILVAAAIGLAFVPPRPLAEPLLEKRTPSLRGQLRFVRQVRRSYIRRYGTWSHLVQFLAVGFSGLVVNLALLTALLRWGVAHDLAVAVAIALSMLWNFALNRRFSFSYARDGAVIPQLLGFVGACSFGAAVNFVVTTNLWDAFDVKQVPAALGVAAGTGFNFLASRFFVFRGKRRQLRRQTPAQ